MRRAYVFAIVAILSIAAVTTVAADQFELSRSDAPEGGVQTVTYDSDTQEITIAIDGTVISTEPATGRQRAAGQEKVNEARFAVDRAVLEVLLADIETNPSTVPDILRLEAAILLLAAER